MKNEKKRDIWLIISISFFAGIGFMSIVNIIKIVYNHHAILYDWIMFAVSIVIIIVCLIMYLTKPGIGLDDKIKKYR